MLTQYGPDLLVTCDNANKLSKILVSNWLERFMFVGLSDAHKRAEEISDWMADHNQFKTHGKPISREDARSHKMIIEDLETDQALQDAILSVYHALSHTFAQAPQVVKIVENHLGKAFIESTSPPAVFPFPFPIAPAPQPQPNP